MKSLIVGMGIGQLYESVLKKLGHTVVTVDLDISKAQHKDVDSALRIHGQFDTVHICTPNFTHVNIARKIAACSKIVFIEKPGAATEESWKQLIKDYPKTRFMMVKNNMWRDNLNEMQAHYVSSKNINLNWINKNRVPKPGSWFTTKSLAYGGVSRDLLPHLLSLFIALEPNYKNTSWVYKQVWQKWTLDDLKDSDYGDVDMSGTYDVDDRVELEGYVSDHKWVIRANWRNNSHDDIAIYFDDYVVPLGLCPESAYKNMISDAVNNLNNNNFWKEQFEIDCWIHRKINL
jgi:predicted dehydrogenase